MTDPPFEPEETEQESEAQIGWTPPRAKIPPPLARAIGRPERGQALRKFGSFILRAIAGSAFLLAALGAWYAAFFAPGPLGAAGLKLNPYVGLYIVIVMVIAMAIVLLAHRRWYGILTGVLTTIVVIVLIGIGLVLLVLYKCFTTPSHW